MMSLATTFPKTLNMFIFPSDHKFALLNSVLQSPGRNIILEPSSAANFSVFVTSYTNLVNAKRGQPMKSKGNAVTIQWYQFILRYRDKLETEIPSASAGKAICQRPPDKVN